MIDPDSDSRLIATTQGNDSDSDSDSAPLVMVMHSAHGIRSPGLLTLIYKKKRPARHRYFRYRFGAISAMGFAMTLSSSGSIL